MPFLASLQVPVNAFFICSEITILNVVMVAISEGNVWVTSCLIALGYLLLVVIHGSLLGSVICSDSGTEVSQAINRIKIGHVYP